jgi:predicted DNA-binding transcriptional regulator AlpA
MSSPILLATDTLVNYDADMDLVGLTQIAELLGMTRAGVHKLIGRESTFPEPVSVLANRTRVWEREAVEKWARETGRIK